MKEKNNIKVSVEERFGKESYTNEYYYSKSITGAI
jgi:hypothetical protein